MKKATGEAVLVKKHPLAIRWFHWINFPVLTIMVWSGLLIFWANRNGPITRFGQPMFPDWFFAPPAPKWLPAWFPTDIAHHERVIYSLTGRLAEGMAWHFTFMWFFALNGLAYVLYLMFSGEWRVIVPKLASFKKALLVALSDLHLVPAAKEDGKYNDAQKVAYTGVILLGLVMLLSGFAIYKPTQAFWLTGLFGGYVMARWFHFWTTMLLCAFFLVHVAQVARAGWNNFRGMVTGYALEYRERKAEPPAPPEPAEEAA
ncbi:MAG TPA: cytochrome b/b6 domain-containing protein [Fimbriimonadaceae bacterium]|nr:cytochrome b/b6 domain-containing protein [Fimbriimonadaceae bacterium]